jgi:hypothetical protein
MRGVLVMEARIVMDLVDFMRARHDRVLIIDDEGPDLAEGFTRTVATARLTRVPNDLNRSPV